MKDSFHKETVLKGLSLSSGVAIARVCRFNERRHQNVDIYRVETHDIEREVERVGKAVGMAVARLDDLHATASERVGPAEAGIFSAQKSMLEDESLISEIESLIRTKNLNAEAAISRVLNSYESRMREIEDDYLSERASDIGDLRRRVIDALKNISPEFHCSDDEHCVRGKDRIVVTDELTPSLTMELDTDRTLGFVTEHGGINSHAAILAKALGIPAVSGIRGIHRKIACGTEIVVNGNSGEVVIWPTDDTIAAIRKEANHQVRLPESVPPVPQLVVMANISLAHEVDEAVTERAEGIGLYRTEFEFIAAGRFLNEDDQFEKYASVVRKMNGAPVTFRLFDAGSDKPMRFLDIPPEENPALGWRGARLLLGNKELLASQARAIARASEYGPVHLLYPMVVDAPQFLELRRLVETECEKVKHGVIRHGAMFEVPSACLESEAMLDVADFGSIGTNDLVQYLFAVDRNNELVAYDYDPGRSALWKLLEMMFCNAEKQGKELAVCGEMAGQPRFIPRFMELGASYLSVSPRLIPGARAVAATVNGSAGTKGAA